MLKLMDDKIVRILCSNFLLIFTLAFCMFIYRAVVKHSAASHYSNNTGPVQSQLLNVATFVISVLSSYLQGCGKRFGSLSLLKTTQVQSRLNY